MSHASLRALRLTVVLTVMLRVGLQVWTRTVGPALRARPLRARPLQARPPRKRAEPRTGRRLLVPLPGLGDAVLPGDAGRVASTCLARS